MAPLIPLVLCVFVELDVDVTTLDGASTSGPLVSWNDTELVVGEKPIPADQLHRISFRDSEVLADKAPVATLADGSRLTLSDVQRAAGAFALTRDGREIQLPAESVVALRFSPLQDRFVETWRDLLARERRDDLFTRVRGESLDHVGCILGDITSERVSLRAGSRDVSTSRSNVFGVLFADRPQADSRVSGQVTLVDGSVLMASKLQWSEDRLTISTGSGLELSLSAEEVAAIDMAAGRLTMLRDLDPRSVDYAPFGDNYDEFAWKFRKDRNALDYPLRVGGRVYPTGLWVHSGTSLSYSLPAKTRRLQAKLGIDELDTPGAAVRVELKVDGETIWSEVVEPDQPLDVDVDLKDARTLSLTASTTKPDGHGIREHLAVVGARLILE